MLVLLVVACGPEGSPFPITETGNPERVLAVATTPADAPEPTVPTVHSAWAGLGETKLVLDEAYAGEHELEWETPEVVADLAAGPVDLRFRSPDAGYTTVILRPRDGRDLPPGAPDALEDASFVVQGTTGDGTPFRIVSPTEEEIELTRPFELRHDTLALALGFDTATWLEGLDLDAADVGSDGVIHVDPSHNEALLTRFEQNLAPSVTLVEDLDEDGQVGDQDLVLSEL